MFDPNIIGKDVESGSSSFNEGPCSPLANPVINENKMVTGYEIKQYKAGKKEQL